METAIIQGFTKESCFLCLLSETVGKRQDQATGIDIDFQTANKHHLRDAEKQDRVCHAQGAGQLGLKAIFCSNDTENMVKF